MAKVSIRLDFMRRLVELIRAGRNPEEFAEEFGPTVQATRLLRQGAATKRTGRSAAK